MSSWLQEGDGRRRRAGRPPRSARVATAPATADGSIDREEISDCEEITLHSCGRRAAREARVLRGPRRAPVRSPLRAAAATVRSSPACCSTPVLSAARGPTACGSRSRGAGPQRGVPTLRLDAAGIGDSDGDASVLRTGHRVLQTALCRAVPRRDRDARRRGLPPRFVMLGLCAGAYWSAQTALADERVASVLMLNPRTLVFDEWRHTLRRTRRLGEQALLPSTWRKVFRGEIMLAKHLETGRTLLGRAARAPMRARGRLGSPPRTEAPAGGSAARHPVEDLFDRLRESRAARAAAVHRQGGAAQGTPRERRARSHGPLAEPRAGPDRHLRGYPHAHPAVVAARGARGRRSIPRSRSSRA